ncbi:hypothetical protein NKJ90_01980 [Mesorhizobium sp. M0051]|uniref:hypothetical protein n=1 Tax=unclassified Mesorhizobium TaxID=325217 RepID=UPI0012EC7150|nr:hypothetical protein [Mesorhizobium sp. LNHC252B00]
MQSENHDFDGDSCGKGNLKLPVLDRDGHIMGQAVATITGPSDHTVRRPVERQWRNIGFADAACSIVCRIA